jgi:hypothetical protein
MKWVIFLVGLLVISGCATTAKKLIDTNKNANTIQSNQNYHALYREVLTVAQDCLAGSIDLILFNAPFVSNKVEGQLHNKLGYGEIDFYQYNLNSIYFARVKISKYGDGSEAAIYAQGSGYLKIFEEYVRGKNTC